MPETPRIPIGDVIDAIITWLTGNVSVLFDTIAAILLLVANIVLSLLSLPHPYVLILIFAALALL
ncbi:MAG: proline/glycine betaine ABC transporter permease, partial [Actinophytocola sp.]|nr:proline/glycine betaine ABC transporter permease [Actinophytocola sp.]